LVDGLYFGLEHFLFNDYAPVDLPEGRTVSYFEELDQARKNLGNEDAGLQESIEGVMRLATTETEQFRRSLVLAKLQNAAQAGHPDRAMYLTMIQA